VAIYVIVVEHYKSTVYRLFICTLLMYADAQEARFERALQERIVLVEASFQRQKAELQDDAEREIASIEQVCQ
jgi:hypothetical protein